MSDYGHGFKPPMKIQYGVAIVWSDPVKAGACKAGEAYVPRWHHFDDLEAADRYVRFYKAPVREKLPRDLPENLKQDIDLDATWLANNVKDVLRATRTAIEIYGDWEITE